MTGWMASPDEIDMNLGTQGWCETGETKRAAIHREVREEAGYDWEAQQ